MKSKSKSKSKLPVRMKKKTTQKNNFWNWIFWWKVDEEEIQKQFNEYNSLSVTQSARGISFLILVFSVVITSTFILFSNDSEINYLSFLDVLAFSVLGFFIYRGKKLAMILAMILWTLEKIYSMFSSDANLITNIIWWAMYMHSFYSSYLVEVKRTKHKKKKNLASGAKSKKKHVSEILKSSSKIFGFLKVIKLKELIFSKNLLIFILAIVVLFLSFGKNFDSSKISLFCGIEKSTELVESSTVNIKTEYGSGSGFFVADDIIVTNNHVVEDVINVDIALNDGLVTTGKVIGWDNEADLAIIKSDIPGLKHLSWAKGKPSVGSQVIAVGYPLNDNEPLKGDATVTGGVISAIRNGLYGIEYIQTDAQINPGNSGGPIADKCGRVVAISDLVFQADDRTTPYFYGISQRTAQIRIEKMLANQTNTAPEGTLPRFKDDLKSSDVVEAYYASINSGDKIAAYQLFTTNRQKEWKPDQWLDLFKSISKIDVESVDVDKLNPMLVTVKSFVFSNDGINLVKSETESKWTLKYSRGLLALDDVEVKTLKEEAVYDQEYIDTIKSEKYRSESFYSSIMNRDGSKYSKSLVSEVVNLIEQNKKIISALFEKVTSSSLLTQEDLDDLKKYVSNDNRITQIKEEFDSIDLKAYYDSLYQPME